MTGPFSRTTLDISKSASGISVLCTAAVLVVACSRGTDANKTAWTDSANSAVASSNIMHENGVAYRLEPDGTRVRIGDDAARIVVENGVTFRVDPSGARVRIDELGGNVGVDPAGLDTPDVDDTDDTLDFNALGNSADYPNGSASGVAAVRIAALCRSAALSDNACRSLNDQFQNLEDGVGALNAPSEMNLNSDYAVALTIGRDEDEAEVRRTAKAEAGPKSTSDVGNVWLAHRMRVTLSGSAFRIRPEGEAERELGLSRQATWRWQVTPTGEGPQSLVATVLPIAVLSDGRRLELEPARRVLDVNVSVTAEQRIGRVERFLKSTTGVLVAAAALIAAVSLVIWRIRNFGRRPE